MTLARKLNALVEERSQMRSGINSYLFDQNSNAGLEKRFNKLRGINKLQKSIVRQNMHNAMSPLSAISGYLELINMSLEDQDNSNKIHYYREQIEHGINEVNMILDQLHGIYSDETDTTDQDNDVSLDVDLNWIVTEVLRTVNMHSEEYSLNTEEYPLYVSVDLFLAKLIIFELINYAKKCTSKSSQLNISTFQNRREATFSVEFETAETKKQEIAAILMNNKDEQSDISNSFNEGLKSSKELADQLSGSLSFISLKDGAARLTFSLPINF